MRGIVSLLLVIFLSGCSSSAEERAIEFMTNAYTGKMMKAEDWMTAEARSQRLFNAFGGIDALVKDSHAEAIRNQGLKSVKIISATKLQNIYSIETEVLFNNNTVSTGKDDWIKDDGKWKITFKPADK